MTVSPLVQHSQSSMTLPNTTASFMASLHTLEQCTTTTKSTRATSLPVPAYSLVILEIGSLCPVLILTLAAGTCFI